MFINPRPTKEILEYCYSNSEVYKYWNKNIFPKTDKARRKHLYKERIERIRKICLMCGFKKNSTLIEVGAGFGSFCDEAKKTGNSIYNEKLNGISNVMVNRWQTELEDWEILLTEIILNELLDEFRYSRSCIKKDVKLMDKAINEISKSELTSEGMTRFLLTQEGFERYPSDPLIQENWDKRVKTHD